MPSLRKLSLLLALLCAACTTTETVGAPTQVLLHVTCDDAALLTRMSAVKISVSSLEAGSWRDAKPATFEVDKFEWPLEVPIFPRKGSDESRQFQVIVQALEADQVLAETRALARFERGKFKRLDRELYACPNDPGRICAAESCRGEACEVCSKAGVCGAVDVFQQLPDDTSRAEPDAGGIDGEDGGDTRGTDASSAADASSAMDARSALDANTSDANQVDADSVEPSANEAGPSTLDAEAGAATDAASDAATDAALPPCDAGMARCGAGCFNIVQSPMNCGRCGRTCRSNACNMGMCTASSIYTHTPNPADAGTYVSAVALDAPLLYYKDPTFDGIQRITTSNFSPSLVTGFAPPNIKELVVDQGYLYSLTPSGGSGPQVQRLPLSQATFEPITGTTSLYPGHLRTNRDRVYVSTSLSITRIVSAPKTGGTSITIAGGPGLSQDFEVDDESAFVRDAVAISRVSASMDNGSTSLIAAFDSGEQCRDMALQGTQLVFASSQRIAIVSKTGGAVTTLAPTSGMQIIADAENAYFVHELGDANCSAGFELYKVPLAGGSAVALGKEPANCRDGNCCPTWLMQDAAALYWVRADGLAIRRLEK